MQTNLYPHRETWLDTLAVRLEPIFAAQGYPIPTNRRVTCGFPSKNLKKRVGECWSHTASYDEHFEVMVSPIIADPLFVASVLAHELCHAAAGLECGHKGPFKTLALGIGLTGKMTATVAGNTFKQHVAPILDDLGPYPHAPLNYQGESSGPKKQGTRMVKVACPDCGYTVRLSRFWLDCDDGAPICPTDHIQMVEG